ncbi:MAG TPA: hypothetical protein VL769_12140 [Acidimicrobiia bacterium]|nr:hypothetical protein [Acidimicrobiia bacterium]
MSSAGLSKARLEHLHDVIAGYVERAELPGGGTDPRGGMQAPAGCGASERCRSCTSPGEKWMYLGTCWRVDPSEEMITILMTQKAWTSPNPPIVCRDFWTSAYAAVDD